MWRNIYNINILIIIIRNFIFLPSKLGEEAKLEELKLAKLAFKLADTVPSTISVITFILFALP